MELPDIATRIVDFATGLQSASKRDDHNLGQVVAGFINHNLHVLVNKFSSQIQAKRITDVSAYALDGIWHRLANGETQRDDGFFTLTVDKSYAHEAFESIMIKARDEPEEKKIPYLGKLIENAYFTKGLDVNTLHFLSKEHERLTYRQLCIIKMVCERNEYFLRGESIDERMRNRTITSVSIEEMSVLTECVDLGNRGYITYDLSRHDNERRPDLVTLLIPHTMRALFPAEQIYMHMDLKSIPEGDVKSIEKLLEYIPPRST